MVSFLCSPSSHSLHNRGVCVCVFFGRVEIHLFLPPGLTWRVLLARLCPGRRACNYNYSGVLLRPAVGC